MTKEIRKEYQILSLACKTARLLLENGSEVHRIEQISKKICEYYGYSCQCFASLTCVVITLENTEGEIFSLVERIEDRNINLNKITRISRLVDNIHSQSYESLKEELQDIQEEVTYSSVQIFLAHIIGAAFFGFLFQGSYREVLVSGITGFFIACTALISQKIKLESLFVNLLQGMVCSSIPCFFYSLHWIDNVDISIISSLMIMVPGVAFINSIRDLFSGDLVTAQSRLLEVALIGMTLAIGSGIALKFFYIS